MDLSKMSVEELLEELATRLRAAEANNAALKASAETAEKQLYELRSEHHPATADGKTILIWSNLYLVADGTGCGPIAIRDRDDRHWEDYEEGERWIITVRDTKGREQDVYARELASTPEAALTARTPTPTPATGQEETR